VHKLRAEYGHGGFLHFGQGKWYPGEQLPRWALSICWRADGQPCWRNPALFADERDAHHYTSEDAAASSRTLARKLGLSDKLHPARLEDVFYYLWRERRLPVNVDPFDSRLDDELERARLRRVFEQKLDAWWAMCCRCRPTRPSRQPGLPAGVEHRPLVLRDERMYLMPGDSPMGYRLPLDSLPWVSKADYPYLIEQDPFAPRRAAPCRRVAGRYALRAGTPGRLPAGRVAVLPGRHASTWRRARRAPAATGMLPQNQAGGNRHGRHPSAARPKADACAHPFESAHWLTRTALCVEVRDPRRASGPKAEAHGEQIRRAVCLHAAAGAAGGLPGPAGRHRSHRCVELGVKIVLEGYPPAARPAPEAAAGHARPRRDRGQHPPRAQLARTGGPHRVSVPGRV
jgi:uncharacterized protein (DUF2126 family)